MNNIRGNQYYENEHFGIILFLDTFPYEISSHHNSIFDEEAVGTNI